MPRLAQRLLPYGGSIFAEISQLAHAAGAVNLGQGDPEIPPAPELLAAAHAGIPGPGRVYARPYGVKDLNLAVAEHSARFYGLDYDPEREVTVTVGASEALMAATLAWVEPGSEVIVFEPCFEPYRAVIEFAGGVVVPVPLLPPDFALDLGRVRAAITPRTRGFLLNSPQNPTGKMFSREELAGLAALCVEYELFAICDEVYEHLAFTQPHLPLAGFPGMRERTIRISSASKTFSVPGWRIGWACCPAELTPYFRMARMGMTLCPPTAFQPAVAMALRWPLRFFAEQAQQYRERRDYLIAAMSRTEIPFFVPDGAMYLVADFSPFGVTDGVAFAKSLPAAAGVAVIPISSFCTDKTPYQGLMRIAFCKPFETLAAGVEKLVALAESLAARAR